MGGQGEGRAGRLDGEGTEPGLCELIVPALIGDGFSPQQGVDDLHRLGESVHPHCRLIEGDPEALVFLLEPTAANPQLQAALGDVIDGDGLLGQEGG